jgi:hypothetical protein
MIIFGNHNTARFEKQRQACDGLECGDMSPLSKRGHVRALQKTLSASQQLAVEKIGARRKVNKQWS